MEVVRQPRPADVPPVLYKYISWRGQKSHPQNLLADNAAYFASAAEFNDPFDCSIALRYDLSPKTFQAEIAKEYAKKMYPHARRADRRRLLNINKFVAKFRKPEYGAAYKEFQEHVYSKIGVFCMSEVNSNILMWAYYSDSHQGLCLGFDMDRFWRFCQELSLKGNDVISPYKVKYVRDYPTLIPNSSNFFDMAMDQLLTKAIDWEHEREYRILYTGGADVNFALDDDIISEVIIGCRMNDSDQEEIVGFLSKRANRPILFKAELKGESFGLNIVPVDY
ncbi:MAG: DUF2971 domain-containing protein [candidate division Zixibacteria bacterium]|nr:DUF2971 domain-containing protein [candidate division Zixibacteria bacterium]